MHERLKFLLADLGLNIKQFAEMGDIPYRTLQDYLAGKITPGYDNLQKMHAVFRVSIDWLLTNEGPIYVKKEAVAGVAESPARYVTTRDKINAILKELSEKDKGAVLEFAEFLKAKKGGD